MTGAPAVPRGLYTIPPGVAFVDALARGLLAATPGAPAALAQVTVLLPNRRACRALAEAFVREADADALLLPAIAPIGDVDAEDDVIGEDDVEPGAADLPPAIPELRRQLLLSELILARGGEGGPMDPAQAARLAAELARLLDQVETEGIGFDRLEALVPDAFARHWQITLAFLRILTESWPAILAAEGALDPAERRNRAIEARLARWRDAPPAGPVVVAGSTGSVPATRRLMKLVADLPNGTVVLPGLDRTLDEAALDALDPVHPQFGLAQLLAALEVRPAEIGLWPGAEPSPAAAARAGLLGAAMRPAGLDGPPPATATIAVAAAGIRRIDCAGPREEAATIALILREALERPDGSAALVTPDRDLARRVAAELRRWHIEIDDSAGRPLDLTPPGTFLGLTARMVADRWAPVALLAALKHPLAAGGLAPEAFRARVRALERAVLRGPRPRPGAEGLRAALGEAGADPALVRWLDGVAAAARPIERLTGATAAPVAALAEAHVALVEWLAATPAEAGADRMWAGEAGEAAALFLAEIAASGRGLAPVAGRAWPGLLETLMRPRVVRPRYGRHPRLHIWGVLESRLQGADRLVLGGLNEGTWPAEPAADPWMSRPMRADFGLPPHERRIGLAAHDFAQAFAAPEVYLTRAIRVGGTPTVPSRWLLRLDNALARAGGGVAFETGPWTGWQSLLDRPAETEPVAAPAPCPPVAARPRRLSVTQVETLIRDPYAVYARHVLGLRVLDPIDADPGAAERGTFVHAALDAFLAAHPDGLPEDALDRLLEHGRAALGPMIERPGVRTFWWPRFERAARWFLDHERERRRRVARTSTEVAGRLELAAPGGPFLLTAKADRIDTLGDGTAAIVDYKTGALPSKREVADGISPQLPLEAAIVAAGGFAGLEPLAVSGLEYWRLSGGDPPGEAKPLADAPGDLARAARDGLAALIAAYDDPETPYHAQPDPAIAPRFDDYTHLERLWEYAPARRTVPR